MFSVCMSHAFARFSVEFEFLVRYLHLLGNFDFKLSLADKEMICSFPDPASIFGYYLCQTFAGQIMKPWDLSVLMFSQRAISSMLLELVINMLVLLLDRHTF